MCDEVIQQYILTLDSAPNSDEAKAEPWPVFFSQTGTNCNNSVIVSTCNWDDGNCNVLINFDNEFNGFAIPTNKTVVFKGSGNRVTNPIVGPLYIPNTTEFQSPKINFTDGTVLTGNVTSAMITNSDAGTIANATWTDRRLYTCMGNLMELALVQLTNYAPESASCDEIFSIWCNSAPNIDPNCNTEYTGDPRCICYHEETCIEDEFTKAGICFTEKDPTCTESSDFVSTDIPVTCFGKGCSNYGYRTAQMQQGTCNASVCEDFVRLYGTELFVSGDTQLYCGNFNYPLNPSPSMTATPAETDSDDNTLPLWSVVLIIVLATVIGSVVVYLIGHFGFHKW